MTIPLEDVQVEQSEPWLKPMDLYIIHQTNASDAQCVSWVLRNITDPEALDAAIRLAGTIRWFDDGVNGDLPYDLIVSTFEACFDSTGNLYPGSGGGAYYSGRAVMWIHTLAMCEFEEFASAFPLPSTEYSAPGLDVNLRHLLQINVALHVGFYLADLLNIDQQYTSSLSMVKRTVTPLLGQTGFTILCVPPVWDFKNAKDHHSSECDTQPPPSVVRLPWLTC